MGSGIFGRMHEPAVTLTDYGLALLAGALALAILRREAPPSHVRPWLVAFFAAAAVAPLFGGTVHGFFPAESSPGHVVLWPATLIAIGVAACGGWAIGARLIFRPPLAAWIIAAACVELFLYALLVLLNGRAFRVAVLNYLPAALFLLGALLVGAKRAERRGAEGAARPFRIAALGLLLTFVAGAIQQLGIGLHPTLLDHNALYHVVQAVALVLFFLGARHLADADAAGLAHG